MAAAVSVAIGRGFRGAARDGNGDPVNERECLVIAGQDGYTAAFNCLMASLERSQLLRPSLISSITI